MPELPEVEALAHHLRERAVGAIVTRIDVARWRMSAQVAQRFERERVFLAGETRLASKLAQSLGLWERTGGVIEAVRQSKLFVGLAQLVSEMHSSRAMISCTTTCAWVMISRKDRSWLTFIGGWSV